MGMKLVLGNSEKMTQEQWQESLFCMAFLRFGRLAAPLRVKNVSAYKA